MQKLANTPRRMSSAPTSPVSSPMSAQPLADLLGDQLAGSRRLRLQAHDAADPVAELFQQTLLPQVDRDDAGGVRQLAQQPSQEGE